MTRIKQAGVASEIAASRRRVNREWARYRELQTYMRDYYPEELEKVAKCRTGVYQLDEDDERPGTYRTYPKHSCHCMPWCMQCAGAERRRRVAALFETAQRCTPNGKPVELAHIVLAAGVDRIGGGDLQPMVKADPGRYFAVCHRYLTEVWGDGTGWYGSYQDFGEAGAGQMYAHMDLTLNRWAYKDGERKLAYQELQGGSKRMLMQKWFDTLHTEYGVRPLENTHMFWTSGWKPEQEYGRMANYQVRELYDVRKIRYDRPGKRVGWVSYRGEGSVTWKPVREAMFEMEVYAQRLGQWGREPEVQLHRGQGHMAKGKVAKTQAACGGAAARHRAGCTCSRCGDWHRAFVPELYEALVGV